MALTPQSKGLSIGQNISVQRPAEQPTRTYAIDWEQGRVRGYVDRTEAMRQAIYKILETERFDHLIYSWRYGTELRKLIGQSQPIAAGRAKRIIEEALLADSRITGIRDFGLTRTDKRTLLVSFTAETIFGATDIKREVSLLGGS